MLGVAHVVALQKTVRGTGDNGQPASRSETGGRSATASLPSRESGLLAVYCGLHALLFGYAALVLPWSSLSLFGSLTLLLAALHLATALLAASRRRGLVRLWRTLGVLSLLYWLWLVWDLGGAALGLGHIYGRLGDGIGAVLIAVVLALAFLTWPVAIWAVMSTRPRIPRLQRWLPPLLLLGAFMFWEGTQMTGTSPVAELEADPGEDGEHLARLLGVRLSLDEPQPSLPGQTRTFLLSRRPVQCERSPDADLSTLLVGYLERSVTDAGKPRARCLQGTEPVVAGEFAKLVVAAQPNTPIKLDWVRRTQRLRPLLRRPLGSLIAPVVGSLTLRPGLDGACFGGRCLAPWQLVAQNLFASASPVRFAQKFKLGVSLRKLKEQLRVDTLTDLIRVETFSAVLHPDQVLEPLRRGRAVQPPLTPERVRIAETAAARHILRAQQESGSFRYQLNFATGRARVKNPSIPRHAGTTLALCELGENVIPAAELEPAIRAATTQLADDAHFKHDVAALAQGPLRGSIDIGSSALGLVALLQCRPFVGSVHDRLIAGLGRLVMRLQAPDGHFNPGLAWRSDKVLQGPTPMFAGGQSIFALSLLEQLLARPEAGVDGALFPAREDVTATLDRAMDYVASDYWPRPLRELFFLRENWHCLAARASLSHHRHDGYERFCLDYVAFKTRFLLTPQSGVDFDVVGAMSFSNLFPPHNGSTAGLGEALAAAIAVARARGEDVSGDLERLRYLLSFLIRQQWGPAACFSCSQNAPGGFTGELVAPLGRIDHTQHAWSAIGHGARQLWPEYGI
jgi:hypothetical protein